MSQVKVRIEITDTAYGGCGVGKDERGKAIFVPHTVTGDIMDARITDEKPSFANAALIEIITPSPMRGTPHCKYHTICGGCHFGHIKYTDELLIKRNILEQALRKIDLPKVEMFHDKPEGYRIRATLRVVNGETGFYKSGSREFVAVDSCPVMKPELFEKVTKWGRDNVQSFNMSVSVIETPQGESLALVDGEQMPRPLEPKPFDGIKLNKKIVGKKHLLYETAAGAVPVNYGGFFQANRYLIDLFQSYAAKLVKGDNVVELYAGSGFFTAALRAHANLKAVESNEAAAKLATKEGYPVRVGDTSDFLKTVAYRSCDSIFVDPPREGIDKKTMKEIVRIAPNQIVYISCSPMTLGRDLLKLSNKYKVDRIAFFDMFPRTYHMESVLLLSRK